MKYPRIHPVRRARRAYRNAADRPTIEVTARGDFIQMRIDQLRQVPQAPRRRQHRRGHPQAPALHKRSATWRAHPPTTNADIKAIVRAWDQAFQTYSARSQRLGGKHNKAFEAAHRQRWEHTKQLVAQHTRGRPGAGKFTHNPEFWTIWLYDVATYLSHRQQGRPPAWTSSPTCSKIPSPSSPTPSPPPPIPPPPRPARPPAKPARVSPLPAPGSNGAPSPLRPTHRPSDPASPQTERPMTPTRAQLQDWEARLEPRNRLAH